MLDKNHRDSYFVFNLSEKNYDTSRFADRVLNFSFPDHHPPPLTMLFQICRAIQSWLMGDPTNVAVVHCKAGRGRTGTVIASYLQYAGVYAAAEDALVRFASMRSGSLGSQGVSVPSQLRYVYYFERVLQSVREKERDTKMRDRGKERAALWTVPARIENIIVSNLPCVVSGDPYVRVAVVISYGPSFITVHNTAWTGEDVVTDTRVPNNAVLFDTNITLRNDICIEVVATDRKNKADITIARAVLHTGFMGPGVHTLQKKDLDVAVKKKSWPNLTVSLSLSVGQEKDLPNDQYMDVLDVREMLQGRMIDPALIRRIDQGQSQGKIRVAKTESVTWPQGEEGQSNCIAGGLRSDLSQVYIGRGSKMYSVLPPRAPVEGADNDQSIEEVYDTHGPSLSSVHCDPLSSMYITAIAGRSVLLLAEGDTPSSPLSCLMDIPVAHPSQSVVPTSAVLLRHFLPRERERERETAAPETDIDSVDRGRERERESDAEDSSTSDEPLDGSPRPAKSADVSPEVHRGYNQLSPLLAAPFYIDEREREAEDASGEQALGDIDLDASSMGRCVWVCVVGTSAGTVELHLLSGLGEGEGEGEGECVEECSSVCVHSVSLSGVEGSEGDSCTNPVELLLTGVSVAEGGSGNVLVAAEQAGGLYSYRLEALEALDGQEEGGVREGDSTGCSLRLVPVSTYKKDNVPLRPRVLELYRERLIVGGGETEAERVAAQEAGRPRDAKPRVALRAFGIGGASSDALGPGMEAYRHPSPGCVLGLSVVVIERAVTPKDSKGDTPRGARQEEAGEEETFVGLLSLTPTHLCLFDPKLGVAVHSVPIEKRPGKAPLAMCLLGMDSVAVLLEDGCVQLFAAKFR
ncbi:tyrosine/serine-protein phosphatase IphP-type [Kipferlia bialata]|uniref:Tyrosine/serine-protein phosphatase IphP-type n=1 Tax=Kipferlia bialata TaxID=797122 RepID=A0A9K3GKP1_9EUKA|nr:tyrosine/serine-protein phosphatase IphP-type [Kipferlia bialata]|eukprot:g8246.t1